MDKRDRLGIKIAWEGTLDRKIWIWGAVVCGLAFIVLTIPILGGQNWPGEWTVIGWALRMRSPAWTTVMQAATFWGSSAVGAGLCAGTSAALFLRRRRLTRDVLLPVAAMFGSAPINFGLRAACGRLRPGVSYIPHYMPELAHPFQRWSYPSGHAMTSLICYGMLAWVLGSAFPRARRILTVLLALWVAAIGFSRVYLGVHWPTDVLAGYLAGGFWLCVCIAAPGSWR